MRLAVDKIASSTRNVPLRRDIRVSPEIVAREGYIVAGRVRGEKSVYNQLEDLYGRMVTLHDGDIVAGVLGHRNALHGYSGFVPEHIRAGDTLQLLNLGGIIGKCTSQNPDVGKPFDVEILGAVLVFPEFESRAGIPAHIGMNAVRYDGNGVPNVPIVYVAGTCMSSGKTSAACRLIRQLALRNVNIGACKLTGVSLRRDTLQMIDYGAKWAASFTDAGIATTSAGQTVPVARGIMQHLAREGADLIVAELGDGILGEYGVQDILADAPLMKQNAALVLCANDPVGAWGAKTVLQKDYQLDIAVVSGPTTDNDVGTRYVREQLGLDAFNARTHGRELGELIATKLDTWKNVRV